MKSTAAFKLGRLFLLCFCVSFTFAFTPPASKNISKNNPPKWQKLGQRKVNRSLDRDEILVTARDGRFSKLRLGVKNSGINMHKMVVHFANGSKQDINLRNNIAAGGTTRVIDISGGRRVIKKVVFWYDTKRIINNKAIVELWGRR